VLASDVRDDGVQAFAARHRGVDEGWVSLASILHESPVLGRCGVGGVVLG